MHKRLDTTLFFKNITDRCRLKLFRTLIYFHFQEESIIIARKNYYKLCEDKKALVHTLHANELASQCLDEKVEKTQNRLLTLNKEIIHVATAKPYHENYQERRFMLGPTHTNRYSTERHGVFHKR